VASRVVVPLAVVALLIPRVTVLAQETAPAVTAYEDRFAQIMEMNAAPGGVAEVSNLVLQRDVARFTFSSGRLYLLTPVGGRTVAALYRGSGTFAFAPTSKIEQDRLARSEKRPAVESPITDVLLLFADTTMAELSHHLTFRADVVYGETRATVQDALKYLGDEDSKTFDPDLMGAWLNGETRAEGFSLDGRVEHDGKAHNFKMNVELDEWLRRAARWWSRGLTDL